MGDYLMNIISDKIPSKGDWGDLSDNDVLEAFEHFSGKSNNELQISFKNNVIQRCSNLRWMPIQPFKYYILGLKQYIESEDYGVFDLPDAASCFIELVEEKAISNESEMKATYPKIRGFIEHLVENQDKYEADEDIYGDFKEKADNIAALLK